MFLLPSFPPSLLSSRRVCSLVPSEFGEQMGSRLRSPSMPHFAAPETNEASCPLEEKTVTCVAMATASPVHRDPPVARPPAAFRGKKQLLPPRATHSTRDCGRSGPPLKKTQHVVLPSNIRPEPSPTVTRTMRLITN